MPEWFLEWSVHSVNLDPAKRREDPLVSGPIGQRFQGRPILSHSNKSEIVVDVLVSLGISFCFLFSEFQPLKGWDTLHHWVGI